MDGGERKDKRAKESVCRREELFGDEVEKDNRKGTSEGT